MDIALSLPVSSDATTEKKEICFTSGSKVLVDTAGFYLGGNACNLAVGLKRLGFATTLIAEFGSDAFAKQMRQELQKEQVSLDYAKITEGAQSTFSVGLQLHQERTLFVHHVARDHIFPLDTLQTEWIYLTSLGREWKTLYRQVLSYKHAHNVLLALNPGTQQLADGSESFTDLLAETDILFVNKEEAEKILYGTVVSAEKKEKEANLLFRLCRMGVKKVCVTDGENGSFFMDEQGSLMHQPAVKPKEYKGKTGAGDAYATGFLGAHISGMSTKEAMVWGSVNASSVIEHIGAQTGLLTKGALEEKIKA